MDTVINLEVLNDHQKTLLTQISYLDINDEGRKKITEGGLLVSELYKYLENPNTLFAGDAGLGENNTQQLTDKVLGENNYITKEQVLTSLIQNGLGNLKITDISEKQKIGTLQANQYSKFRLVIWVDGNDRECHNALLGGLICVNLKIGT